MARPGGFVSWLTLGGDMPESNGRNGVWKVLAVALLSALLSGGGALMLTAAKTGDLTQRLAVEETKSRTVEQRLDRIEDKVDELLDRVPKRGGP